MSDASLKPPSPDFPADVAPRPDDPLGPAAQHSVLALVRRLLPRLEQAYRAATPEGVHQLRVTTRRLRSALRTFESLWPEQAQEWTRGLGQLADSCGRARDLDVLVADLGERLPGSGGSRAAALAWMLSEAEAERGERQLELRRDLLRFCESGLLEQLVATVSRQPRDLRATAGGSGA